MIDIPEELLAISIVFILLGMYLFLTGLWGFVLNHYVTFTRWFFTIKRQTTEGQAARLFSLMNIISGAAIITVGGYTLATGFDVTSPQGIIVSGLALLPYVLAAFLNRVIYFFNR